MQRRILYTAAIAAAACIVPQAAFAHAFGANYTLPLPLAFYFVAAGAALVASFAILALFSRPHAAQSEAAHVRSYRLFGVHTYAIYALKALGLVVLGITLITAFFGGSEVGTNPTPILFWIVLLLGMTYLAALVGGLWEKLNPFKTLSVWFIGEDSAPLLRYPASFGYLPALALYFALLWFELLSFGLGTVSSAIGTALLGYVVLSFAGALIFGTRNWFTYGDFFSVFFGVVGRFAPLQLTEKELQLTWPGERLIEERPAHLSLLVFILFMLSSTAFDALKETEPWIDFFFRGPLQDHYHLFLHTALILSPFVFLALYTAAIYLMKLLAGMDTSLRALLLRFALSLVPIVVVYHFAHYAPLLIFEGQNIIPMLSDPLAKGWNLLGTAGYSASPDIIGAKAVWYLQIIPIIVGHIIATYIAHRIALRECSTRTAVILGQLPMLLLMVAYTVFGLWILSLPFGVGV